MFIADKKKQKSFGGEERFNRIKKDLLKQVKIHEVLRTILRSMMHVMHSHASVRPRYTVQDGASGHICSDSQSYMHQRCVNCRAACR